MDKYYSLVHMLTCAHSLLSLPLLTLAATHAPSDASTKPNHTHAVRPTQPGTRPGLGGPAKQTPASPGCREFQNPGAMTSPSIPATHLTPSSAVAMLQHHRTPATYSNFAVDARDARRGATRRGYVRLHTVWPRLQARVSYSYSGGARGDGGRCRCPGAPKDGPPMPWRLYLCSPRRLLALRLQPWAAPIRRRAPRPPQLLPLCSKAGCSRLLPPLTSPPLFLPLCHSPPSLYSSVFPDFSSSWSPFCPSCYC